MSIYTRQAEALRFHLDTLAPLERLRDSDTFAHVDRDMLALMLEQAVRFCEQELEPLAARGDTAGCRLDDGQVRLPAGTPEVYRQWCELGFSALSQPLDHDGMDLPASLQCAIQELCDGANLAFGMLGINLRGAASVLLQHGGEEMVRRWLPGLVSGEISSTIAISEPQAGSDLGRIRASARPTGAGAWAISGAKIWISYGDHDATPQIVHLVLARVPGGAPGTRGLGLFAVPKYRDDSLSPQSRNPIRVGRLEHKMGLHASPTCVLEFEDAEGWLIGAPGEGIRILFVMMNAMRLAVAVQGAAVANASTLHALDYARERPQGGDPAAAPAMIVEHADVKRMLLEMTAQAELLRGLALRTAFELDLARASGDAGAAAGHRQAAELLLPLAKTVNAELGFEVASQGIQVLGGYGYTNDYPIERMLRDIRVASIYEGTSGIQAMDFLHRRVARDSGAALQALLARVEESLALAAPGNPLREPLQRGLADYRQVLERLLRDCRENPDGAAAAAYAFLRLSGHIMCGWCALDLYGGAGGDTDYQRRLRDALALYAGQFEADSQRWRKRCGLGPAISGCASLR